MRAKIAAHTRWAGTDDRTAATAPARAGLRDRFVKQARKLHPDLSEQEIAARAESLRRAFYLKLALASARARRTRKAGKS